MQDICSFQQWGICAIAAESCEKQSYYLGCDCVFAICIECKVVGFGKRTPDQLVNQQRTHLLSCKLSLLGAIKH